MSTYGYNLSELIAAVNSTPSIPTLTVAQIPQVVFHCEDIYGNITGNSFCINGCLASTSLTLDDECQIASNGTACPTTTTITITAGSPPPTCFKQCQTWCFGGPSPSMASAMHAVPTTVWV
ncbi:hypothetical protein N7528_004082 [Penicillium herquei]|nr:hypothetical protein N7528_004082 [Penicillium herquei]